MLAPTAWLPSRRLALALLAGLLLLPFVFSALRQRLLYGSFGGGRRFVGPYPQENVDSVVSLSHSNLKHTDFFHVPIDHKTVNYCNVVGAGHVQQIAHLARPINVSVPVAFHFQDGRIITDSNNGFPIGTGFCSVILVPQVPSEMNSIWTPTPIEGMGPDAVTAEMESPDVRVTFTESIIYWGDVNITVGDSLDPPVALGVYASSYVLNHPGDYQMSASSELGNYQWTMEEPINLIFKTPDELRQAQQLSFAMSLKEVEAKSPPISVIGLPVSRPTQPCYQDGFDDLRGRWYRAKAFDAGGNQTALNPRTRLEAAEHNNTIDEWGWTFAPDACELAYFTGTEHLACMENRSVQLVGDSNVRRLGKSLVGGGERWCLTNATDLACQCSDSDEKDIVDATGAAFDASRFSDIYEQRDKPAAWGRNSTLYFDFVGGLNNPHWGNEWHIYYNTTRGPSLLEERQRKHGPIDLVYISLVVWDLVGVLTPAETLDALAEFRGTLLASYPETTRFVIRLANSVCCGQSARFMRFSPPRFHMWNTLWREFWAPDYADGRVVFVDASALQDRVDVAIDIPCGPPHLPCGHVRLEQMMFVNAVCERGSDGEVRMRDWADRRHLARPLEEP